MPHLPEVVLAVVLTVVAFALTALLAGVLTAMSQTPREGRRRW